MSEEGRRAAGGGEASALASTRPGERRDERRVHLRSLEVQFSTHK